MKKDKIIYWLTTGFFSVMMFLGAYMYFSNGEIAEIYKKMGFPDFLRVEIGIAKVLGGIVLLVPTFSQKIKEWAYAGFGILLISAILTHYLQLDPIEKIIHPAILLAALIISNIYYTIILNSKKGNI